MNIEYTENGLVKVIASKGKKITNINRDFFSDYIYLGVNDTSENYEEVSRDIWKEYIVEENLDIEEMKNQLKDLQEETAALKEETIKLKNENTLLTELLLENDYRILQQMEMLNNSQKVE